jgi:hypothetical protein
MATVVRRTGAATAALLALAACAVADTGTPTGTAQITGGAKLAVRRCGVDRDPNFAGTVALLTDGTWAGADAAGDAFAGTWTAVGTRGRSFDLFFDAATEADLIQTVVDDVGVLCDAPGGVVVTSVARKRFVLALNRARTKATLVLRYVFQGRANDRQGTAVYRVRAKGPFVAVP